MTVVVWPHTDSTGRVLSSLHPGNRTRPEETRALLEPGTNRRYDYVRVGTETAAREITVMVVCPVVYHAGSGHVGHD